MATQPRLEEQARALNGVLSPLLSLSKFVAATAATFRGPRFTSQDVENRGLSEDVLESTVEKVALFTGSRAKAVEVTDIIHSLPA